VGVGKGKTNWIGDDSRADEDALARMGERAAAVKPAGWPDYVRGGIFDGTEQSEDPACGGRMRRSFALKRDLNRPMQPRSSDLTSQISKHRYQRASKRRSDIGA